ncbi:MAG: tetratricopeptide repeat protein [bacterium]|nr:tetratricopeptide repeat protein [bacterium]
MKQADPRRSRTRLLCLAGFAALAPAATGVPDDIDAARRESVIARISEELEAKYVFADVAQRCGEHLRAELGAGKFDALTEPGALATALTEALQSISKDKHMRVQVRPPERARVEREDPVIARLQRMDRTRRANFGFERVERLEGNVGYIDMRSFSPLELTRDTASAAMAFVANTDAIIFDMRKNGGGSPETVQFVCSYFFGQRTHLNSLYWRAGDVTQEFWTLDEVPGKRLPDVPLFVLTSSYTFSGAEEFTYNLLTRERATIVGEKTGGGANPGGVMMIDAGFQIFVPTGRAINPVTGTNWEGVGIEPHITVPASEALDRALVDARKAAEARRAARTTARAALWTDVTDGLLEGAKLLKKGNTEDGTRAVDAALKLASDGDILEEWDINMLGYEYLQKDSVDASIAIFRFNTGAHPKSSNVWDSLGEAYMRKGENDLAIRSYERSLELDPNNANAVEMIARMKKK